MRTIIVALVALLTFGSVAAQAGSGKWRCHGPGYACNGNSYKAVKKSTYRKSATSKKRYTKKSYAKKRTYKNGYAKSKKRAYRKSKKYAKRKYTKNRYSGGGTLSGKASYYWQPQRVASGGWFNPKAMTAAHKTLPFGTRVRVTNRHNGRSVVVRINDRGPYIKGRIIDLSKAAAYKIGMQNAGVVPVTVTILGRG